MIPLQHKLVDMITEHHELETDIKASKIKLDFKNYEIDNIRDAIIEEYEKSLEEKQQEIENLKEIQK